MPKTLLEKYANVMVIGGMLLSGIVYYCTDSVLLAICAGYIPATIIICVAMNSADR